MLHNDEVAEVILFVAGGVRGFDIFLCICRIGFLAMQRHLVYVLINDRVPECHIIDEAAGDT